MERIQFQDLLTPFPFADSPSSNVFYQKGVDVSNFRMIKNNIIRVEKRLIRNKDLSKILCDCQQSVDGPFPTCGTNCLNKMLFIEWLCFELI